MSIKINKPFTYGRDTFSGIDQPSENQVSFLISQAGWGEAFSANNMSELKQTVDRGYRKFWSKPHRAHLKPQSQHTSSHL
tara:strand:+ start:27994 stop:28233 length:240 start_codon:yes stop_codon:yes gene_type:complete